MKLTDEQINDLRADKAEGMTIKQLRDKYGVSTSYIYSVAKDIKSPNEFGNRKNSDNKTNVTESISENDPDENIVNVCKGIIHSMKKLDMDIESVMGLAVYINDHFDEIDIFIEEYKQKLNTQGDTDD